MKKATTTTNEFNTMFWVHLFFMVLSWVGPFLFTWQLLLLGYSCVYLQFFVFNRCLMNEGHSISEDDDNTFYAYLLELMGFKPNKKKLRFFVRKVIYIILGAIAVFWQYYLGYPPLLF